MRLVQKALAAGVVSGVFLFGAAWAEQLPQLEFSRWVKHFAIPKSEFMTQWGWQHFTGNALSVKWDQEGLEWGETDFYKTGRSIITINGRAQVEAGARRPEAKGWDVELRGPRAGVFEANVKSGFYSETLYPHLLLDTLRWDRIEHQVLTKQKLTASTGQVLIRIEPKDKKTFWGLDRWRCVAKSCEIYVTLFTMEDEARKAYASGS